MLDWIVFVVVTIGKKAQILLIQTRFVAIDAFCVAVDIAPNHL